MDQKKWADGENSTNLLSMKQISIIDKGRGECQNDTSIFSTINYLLTYVLNVSWKT